MVAFITSFKTAFTAEHIKKKGTGIYLLSVLIGALSPIILFISRLGGSTRHIPRKLHNGYGNFIEVALELFSFYLLPLLIIILASRITQLDHKNKGWQLMETLPIEKFGNYFSKFSIIIIANIIAVFTFAFTSIVFVYLLSVTGSLSNLSTTDLPIAFVFNIALRLLVATLFLSALQYVFSVIFSNFLIPIFIGIIGFSFNTYLNETDTLLSWYPYASLSNIFHYPNGSNLGHNLIYIDVLSIIGCAILLYIGYYWFKLKSLKRVFIDSKKQFVKSSIVLVSLVILFFYVQKPKQYQPHNYTILKGKIESSINFKTLTVVEPFTNETILTIPVSDNTFNYKIEKKIPLNNYNVFFDNDHRSKVIFGTNDSIYIDFKIDEKLKEFNVTGTRLAENTLKIRDEGSQMFYWIEDTSLLQNSTLFFNEMKKEWTARANKSKEFKTVDNYKVREDFENRNETLLIAEYNYYLKEYKKKVMLIYPKKKIIVPTDLQQLESPIPYDETLLNSNLYLYTILEQLSENKDQNTDKDSQVLQALSKMKSNAFKDKLMYWQLNKSIQEVSKNGDIDVLINTYINEIKNSNYKSKILAKASIKRSLKKGANAPFFKAETLQGKTITLNDLKGKYTVIDVWATWCIPCKKDAPYFEKFALKYTNENVQFVSISMDRNKDRNKWKLRSNELSETVIQLRSLDEKAFMKAYNIHSLPRYIILDPDGKILNIDLPRPSKSNFEPILKSNL